MIRIGIVGCGRILAAHLRGYRLLREAGVDDFRVTALCARRADDARSYVRRGEGPPQRPPVSDTPGDPLAIANEYLSDFQPEGEVAVFDDYREMIASDAVDAVNDFSTHGLHHLVADEARRRGKHLLTQKPLAATVALARRMCERFDRAGLVLGVFENARFKPSTRHAKWLIDTGRLGAVQWFGMGNVGAWWAPDRIVAQTPWRHRRREAGGVALDLGVHQFHLARHVAGEVDSVVGQTLTLEPTRYTRDDSGRVIDQLACDADDTFSAAFLTEAGAAGLLFCSWAGHGEPTLLDSGPVIHGARGRLAGDRWTDDDGTVREAAACYLAECEPARREREFPLGLSDPFALTQHDWLASIREGRRPETDGREGLRDLACAYAILESSLGGRRVAVDDVLSGAVAEYQRELDSRLAAG